MKSPEEWARHLNHNDSWWDRTTAPPTLMHPLGWGEKALAANTKLIEEIQKDAMRINNQLVDSIAKLNIALDDYWNSDYGVKLTGMVEKYMKNIIAAQQESKELLQTTRERMGGET